MAAPEYVGLVFVSLCTKCLTFVWSIKPALSETHYLFYKDHEDCSPGEAGVFSCWRFKDELEGGGFVDQRETLKLLALEAEDGE
jgi:hypothetical protein